MSSISDFRETLSQLSTIHPQDHELKDHEKSQIDNKIDAFVTQNEKLFASQDIGALHDLQHRAKIIGGNQSSTAQKIDHILATYRPKAEELKKEFAFTFQAVATSDPHVIAAEADELWKNRAQGAYALLDKEGVLKPMVYALYEAAAKRAEDLGDKKGAQEIRDKSSAILAQIDPRRYPTFTTRGFKEFLQEFLKSNPAADPVKYCQNLAMMEIVAPSQPFDFSDEPLLKEVQKRIQETSSQAIESHLRLLRRKQTTLMALLPPETQTSILDYLKNPHALVNLIKQDVTLREVSSKQAAALLESFPSDNMDADTTSKLASLAAAQARKVNLADYDTLTDQQFLRLLKACPNIEELDLAGCRSLTTQVLREIAVHLPKLTHLTLTGCPQVDDACIESFSRLNLQSLILNGCAEVTDRGLFSLQNCTQLQVLSFANSPSISATGMSYLSEIPSLQNLSLANCQGITDDGLGAISHHPNIQVLNLANLQNISAQGVIPLHNIPSLESLALIHCGRENFLTSLLWHNNVHVFDRLRVLDVSLNNLLNEDSHLLRFVYALPSLRHLIVRGLSPDREGITKFSGILGAIFSIVPPLVNWKLNRDIGTFQLAGLILFGMFTMAGILGPAGELATISLPPSNNPNLQIHQ